MWGRDLLIEVMDRNIEGLKSFEKLNIDGYPKSKQK